MLWAPKFRKLAKYLHMVSISLPTGEVFGAMYDISVTIGARRPIKKVIDAERSIYWGVKPLIFDLRLIIKKFLAIVFWIKMP